MNDTDIVADLRECAAESRDLEGDYYADQFTTPPEVFERAAVEIERLRDTIRRLAEQDATLSVQGGNVTVMMDAALTDEERAAVRFCVTASLPETQKLGGVAGELCRMHAATLRGLLERLA